MNQILTSALVYATPISWWPVGLGMMGAVLEENGSQVHTLVNNFRNFKDTKDSGLLYPQIANYKRPVVFCILEYKNTKDGAIQQTNYKKRLVFCITKYQNTKDGAIRQTNYKKPVVFWFQNTAICFIQCEDGKATFICSKTTRLRTIYIIFNIRFQPAHLLIKLSDFVFGHPIFQRI